mmetsp:Transcript_14781/g.31314  ORF Transcript_14781/g.31314 Transcript_14781/m.31314 type:complete len:213 (-) Transcript_14781:267-905(-)
MGLIGQDAVAVPTKAAYFSVFFFAIGVDSPCLFRCGCGLGPRVVDGGGCPVHAIVERSGVGPVSFVALVSDASDKGKASFRCLLDSCAFLFLSIFSNSRIFTCLCMSIFSTSVHQLRVSLSTAFHVSAIDFASSRNGNMPCTFLCLLLFFILSATHHPSGMLSMWANLDGRGGRFKLSYPSLIDHFAPTSAPFVQSVEPPLARMRRSLSRMK